MYFGVFPLLREEPNKTLVVKYGAGTIATHNLWRQRH